MQSCDIVIVGAGIAGLYASYRLRSTTRLNIVVLERERMIGGRAWEVDFHGQHIKTGAGIVHREYNPRIFALLGKLQIRPVFGKSQLNPIFLQQPMDMQRANKQIVQKFKEVSADRKRRRELDFMDAQTFIMRYFGQDFLRNYTKNADSADFLGFDIRQFIKKYDIHYMNHKQHEVGFVSWNAVADALAENNRENIVVGHTVKSIRKEGKKFIVDEMFRCSEIIFAVSLSALRALLPQVVPTSVLDIDKCIGSVPFFRAYAFYRTGHGMKLGQGVYLVENELQKVIVISDKIAMVAYADQHNAIALHCDGDANKQRALIRRLLREVGFSCDFNDLRCFFFADGIHYWRPRGFWMDLGVQRIRHPAEGVHIVGEAVSQSQGWVEGCLEW